MYRNELFDRIIRETTPEKDYLFQPLEPINNAGEPFHAFENTLFERILREAEINQRIKIKKTAAYRKWYAEITDEKLKNNIRTRLQNIKKGNFGKFKSERYSLGLIIDYGPGYRIYFIKSGQTVVILLCGGDKSTQDSDINIKVKGMVAGLKERKPKKGNNK